MSSAEAIALRHIGDACAPICHGCVAETLQAVRDTQRAKDAAAVKALLPTYPEGSAVRIALMRAVAAIYGAELHHVEIVR